ncbi:hypothetical protein INT48_001141 [Thamnidium elegans]|uniref:Alcohol dehydrogenase-like N-terminal domain-containing protein n=1 Tax=Thamnidium elegans TaxID=101142 RepID=A0A8H7VXA5_9FUNG|nr:hypothetical protein INT48_001141 [Thamnidium elegans]
MLVKKEIELKTWDQDTMELQITHCGLCGIDQHVLNEDWGRTSLSPCCVVGHEIAGIVTRVEKLCHAGVTTTFNTWPNGDTTYGGFAKKWRGGRRYIQKIPKGLSNEDAAPLFCAVSCVYTPMVRWGIKPRSVVGVLGMSGLGNFAVLFAKAM